MTQARDTTPPQDSNSNAIALGPSPSADLAGLHDFLRDHLFGHVMPFWQKFAVDDAGGINTCLRDDGTLINRDKWLWSQWRAVWVFSTLYQDFGRDPQWLSLAEHVMNFCGKHGWIENQGWALRLAHDGRVVDGYESFYVNCFAIYGLTAFYRATGSAQAAALARQTADLMIEQIKQPHDSIPHFPYPVPSGASVHGIPMMGSLMLWELGQALDDDGYRQPAMRLTEQVMTEFYRSDRDLLLERIASDGSEYPGLLGTAVVPGHVIESMWFQMHIARDRGDEAMMRQCCRLIRRHLEIGWDAEHGGLLLAVDAEGNRDVGWDHHTTKLWWPHTETLYALLLAHETTGESWCLDWYDRVHQYSFSHYPLPQGEWIQKLDQLGQPITDVVALPVKDPFHLPRALILSIQSLARMTAVNGE